MLIFSYALKPKSHYSNTTKTTEKNGTGKNNLSFAEKGYDSLV